MLTKVLGTTSKVQFSGCFGWKVITIKPVWNHVVQLPICLRHSFSEVIPQQDLTNGPTPCSFPQLCNLENPWQGPGHVIQSSRVSFVDWKSASILWNGTTIYWSLGFQYTWLNAKCEPFALPLIHLHPRWCSPSTTAVPHFLLPTSEDSLCSWCSSPIWIFKPCIVHTDLQGLSSLSNREGAFSAVPGNAWDWNRELRHAKQMLYS